MQFTLKTLSTYKRIYLILLLPLGYLLIMGSRMFINATEFYASEIYLPMSGVIAFFTGLLPFSLLEFGLILGIPLFIIITVICSLKIKTLRQRILYIISTFLAATGIIYFMFAVFCGVNYNRHPLSMHMDLELKPSTAQELQMLCTELIASANVLAEQVPRDSDGVAYLSFDTNAMLAEATYESFAKTAQTYTFLEGANINAKAILLSQLMSYTDITGVFSPFTIEANYNSHAPSFLIPSTIAHELAHVRGFMREDEANFIGFLTTANSDNPEIAYSGVMLATIHSMNALYRTDIELFIECDALYNDKVKADLKYQRDYWEEYEGAVAEITENINDTYLKANNQTHGVKSYGRMVDLLLAYYRQ